MSTLPDQSLIERVQAEVQEIAVVLSKRSGKSIAEVWDEALTVSERVVETRGER